MKLIQKKCILGITGVFLFIFLASSSMHAKSFDQSMLVDKQWVHLSGKPFYGIISFTDKEQISKFVLNDTLYDENSKDLYYLSDVIVDKFEPDSVGTCKSGRYIVVLVKPKIGEDHLEIYEILELTDTTLKTKHLRSGTVLEYEVKKIKTKK